MLFFKAVAAVVVTLPLLAVANPVAARGGSNACNTGTLNCCAATSTGGASGLLSGLLTGLGCSPMLPIVGGLTSCSQQTVCCTGNTFNGLVAIGCTPINIGL